MFRLHGGSTSSPQPRHRPFPTRRGFFPSPFDSKLSALLAVGGIASAVISFAFFFHRRRSTRKSIQQASLDLLLLHHIVEENYDAVVSDIACGADVHCFREAPINVACSLRSCSVAQARIIDGLLSRGASADAPCFYGLWELWCTFPPSIRVVVRQWQPCCYPFHRFLSMLHCIMTPNHATNRTLSSNVESILRSFVRMDSRFCINCRDECGSTVLMIACEQQKGKTASLVSLVLPLLLSNDEIDVNVRRTATVDSHTTANHKGGVLFWHKGGNVAKFDGMTAVHILCRRFASSLEPSAILECLKLLLPLATSSIGKYVTRANNSNNNTAADDDGINTVDAQGHNALFHVLEPFLELLSVAAPIAKENLSCCVEASRLLMNAGCSVTEKSSACSSRSAYDVATAAVATADRCGTSAALAAATMRTICHMFVSGTFDVIS